MSLQVYAITEMVNVFNTILFNFCDHRPLTSAPSFVLETIYFQHNSSIQYKNNCMRGKSCMEFMFFSEYS